MHKSIGSDFRFNSGIACTIRQLTPEHRTSFVCSGTSQKCHKPTILEVP
jgi:hypothetical protein